MKTILLIRHGMTQGNLEKRYVGRTDQPLCAEGFAQARILAQELLPLSFDAVFSSPLLRCRQTAEMLFPGQEISIVKDLMECDFGAFENRTAEALAADPDYTKWVEGGCTDPIPGGEDVIAFKERSAGAFFREAKGIPKNGTAAFVIHGGTIMAILERFVQPRRSFYKYHLGNCAYYECRLSGGSLAITKSPAPLTEISEER
jgi:alpha-ribazole phosphatase